VSRKRGLCNSWIDKANFRSTKLAFTSTNCDGRLDFRCYLPSPQVRHEYSALREVSSADAATGDTTTRGDLNWHVAHSCGKLLALLPTNMSNIAHKFTFTYTCLIPRCFSLELQVDVVRFERTNMFTKKLAKTLSRLSI